VNDIIRQRLTAGKLRIGYRLGVRQWPEQAEPMFTASNIHYEVAERTRAV